MDLTSGIHIKQLNWYNCGPTIYNHSHLGHAKTFIVFDAMVKYYKKLGFDIKYCMNITDIDDKIVKKVTHKKISNIIKSIINTEGIKRVALSWGIEIHPSALIDIIDNIANFDYLLKWIQFQRLSPISIKNLVPTLDEYYNFIHNMEKDFWEDMESINVSKPDEIIRVSENIQDIIKFISVIIENGYAYVSEKSVYFDSQKYIEDGFNFSFLTNSDNNEHNKTDYADQKKDPRDFALWKSAKTIDISFESPWGLGRPGWHIECSTMIYKIFGNKIDVHSGGIDLKFPHHNNEVVQTIAFNKKETGVPDIFLHSGHIMNDGKMSQSLGNSITIKEYLKSYGTSRLLRLIFFMHKWNTELIFSNGIMEYAFNIDKKIEDFIRHTKFIGREVNSTDENISFRQTVKDYEKNINDALLDKFSTDKCIMFVEQLIKETYVYLESGKYDPAFVVDIGNIVMNFFKVLDMDYHLDISKNTNVTPFVDTIVEIRDKIRDMAKLENNLAAKQHLFEITDWIRDEKLSDLKISIEDSGFNKSTKWTFL